MILHPCREGERIHFLPPHDLEAALRYGYLEQQLFADSGMTNRLVLYHPEQRTYEWYEALEGMVPDPVNRRTYTRLEILLAEHDVHAYKWYPLFPTRKVLFDYHGALEQQQRDTGSMAAVQWERIG